MCSRESTEHEIPKVGDLNAKVTKIEERLEETNRKLDLVWCFSLTYSVNTESTRP